MNGRKQRGPCHVHVEDVISVKYSGGSKKERAIFFTHRIKLIKITDHVLVKFFCGKAKVTRLNY